MRYERLRSIRVNSTNESIFYNYIKDNFEGYFFFHVDYAQYPQDTEICMALDDNNKVQGMLLIWKNRRLQLRGSNESLEFLLSNRIYTPISITGFESHRNLIARFFPDYKKEIALYRMGMKKGEQKDFEKFPYEILKKTHKKEIIAFMRKADPIFWGSRNLDDILIDQNNKWFGIIEKGNLISITSVWSYQKIGYITVVGTHPEYRNTGLASSLISSVLKEVFQDKEQCLITVRVANDPAVHTYKKLGFSIYNTQYSYEID
ncbi:MAG: GNAT family N-acetyltransferase [Candidatus Thorarchaeota archaeon]